MLSLNVSFGVLSEIISFYKAKHHCLPLFSSERQQAYDDVNSVKLPSIMLHDGRDVILQRPV